MKLKIEIDLDKLVPYGLTPYGDLYQMLCYAAHKTPDLIFAMQHYARKGKDVRGARDQGFVLSGSNGSVCGTVQVTQTQKKANSC